MKPIPDITRRDFLKLSSAGALSLLLSQLRLGSAPPRMSPNRRITLSGLPIYDGPTFRAKNSA
jgi:hypothetical protein